MIASNDYSGLGVGGGPTYQPGAASGGPNYKGGPMNGDGSDNNYARPGGQQNVGNFITDRPSSRVLAPPGGQSSISFGGQQQDGRRAGMPPRAPPPLQQQHQQHQQQQHDLQQHYDQQRRMQAHGVSHGMLNKQGLPTGNNYARPNGQNCNNFITDRPSSKVLAPPGGQSSIALGSYQEPPASFRGNQVAKAGRRAPSPPTSGAPQAMQYPAPPVAAYTSNNYHASDVATGNNYARPGGQQNVGNFLSDRPSSKVLAPPGGKSSLSLGSYQQGSPNKMPTRRTPSPAHGRRSGSPPQSGPSYGGMPGMPPPHAMHQYANGHVPPSHPASAASQQRQCGQGHQGVAVARESAVGNNYARPGGQQNVGNFITDKPSSRVLAPPGGRTAVVLG